jgi:hypothetical protein
LEVKNGQQKTLFCCFGNFSDSLYCRRVDRCFCANTNGDDERDDKCDENCDEHGERDYECDRSSGDCVSYSEWRIPRLAGL